MDQRDHECTSDELWAQKRERQAQDIEAVRRGERTQESMFAFSRETVSGFAVVHTREFEWTELES